MIIAWKSYMNFRGYGKRWALHFLLWHLWARMAKNQLIAQHEDGTVLLKFSSNQNRCKKIMKTNDFYKIINGIESFFLKRKLWYYYHGSNEQRVIEKIRLLFFIVNVLTCNTIKKQQIGFVREKWKISE